VPGRCFLAFELPGSAVRLLGDTREIFLEAADGWVREKWVRPELLHVTLAFIGPVPDAEVSPLLDELRAACAGLATPHVELAGLRAVPSAGRASWVWATLADPDGACGELAAAVHAPLERRLGLPPDTRRFLPHVTLCRARAPRPVPHAALEVGSAWLAAGRDAVGKMAVRTVTLHASTLGPSGPRYETLGSVPVGG
jgi:2'-5' RNA ligase